MRPLDQTSDWIESFPAEGDIVLCQFADYTALPDAIGVVVSFHMHYVKVNFGCVIRYIDRYATFFVYRNAQRTEVNSW